MSWLNFDNIGSTKIHSRQEIETRGYIYILIYIYITADGLAPLVKRLPGQLQSMLPGLTHVSVYVRYP